MIRKRALRRLFDPNLNLSPEARALVSHVALSGSGWVEIRATTVQRLLQVRDARKARRAIAEAVDAGWLEYDPDTGPGHGARFRFVDAENAHTNLECAKNAHTSAGMNAVECAENAHTNFVDAKNAHTNASRARDKKQISLSVVDSKTETTTTTTTAGAGEPVGFAAVREYLGSSVVETALASQHLTHQKLMGLYGSYGPHGIESGRFFSGVSPPDRAAILSTAVQRFSTDSDKFEHFTNQLFASYLRRAKDEYLVTPAQRNSTNLDSRGRVSTDADRALALASLS